METLFLILKLLGAWTLLSIIGVFLWVGFVANRLDDSDEYDNQDEWGV